MNKQSKEFMHVNDLEWKEVAPGMKRQLLGYNDSVLMAKVKFERGGVGALHDHFHAQVTYVESGVFEVEIEGERRILKAGDAFFIPPHKKHGAVCHEEGVLIDVFSPVREDFFTDKE